MKQPIEAFLDHFSTLEDVREPGKVLPPLPEILLVTLCGVIAGAEGWEDIEDYGESKLELLRELLPFADGIPSDDTLRRRAGQGITSNQRLCGRSPPRAGADGDSGEKQRNDRDSRTAATARPARRHDFHRRHGLPA